MNQHLLRGNLLVDQGRFDLAVEELRKAAALEPDDSTTHAMLSLALLRSGHGQEALREAETALEKDPNDAYAHLALALVRVERNELKPAETSIRQAIELDPESATLHGLLARIQCEHKRFEEALATADQGLAMDASDDLCLSFRARALMELGRKTEAEHVAAKLLLEAPEDAWNHWLRGDQLLLQGDAAGARVHFLEALRLDPRNDQVRNGLATSLKARSPVYGILLKALIRLQRLRNGALLAGIIALFFALRFGDAWVRQHPDWMVPYEGPKALFFGAFIVVIIANPMFDLLLRFDRDGRHALSPDEIQVTNWYLVCLGFGGLCLAWASVGRSGALPRGMAVAAFLLCNAVSEVFQSTPGYVRKRMSALSAIAGACLVLTPLVGFTGVLLVAAKLTHLGVRLVLLTFWMPVAVMVFAALSENIRGWLEKRRPDPGGGRA